MGDCIKTSLNGISLKGPAYLLFLTSFMILSHMSCLSPTLNGRFGEVSLQSKGP